MYAEPLAPYSRISKNKLALGGELPFSCVSRAEKDLEEIDSLL
jgi:hypothetical protein